MNNRFIPSHGIGEVLVDPFDMTWSNPTRPCVGGG